MEYKDNWVTLIFVVIIVATILKIGSEMGEYGVLLGILIWVVAEALTKHVNKYE